MIYRILFTFLTLGLVSCTNQSKEQLEEQVIKGEAQGTTYTVKYIGKQNETLPKKLDSLLLAIDNSMSTWVESSTISKFNRGDSIEIDPMFKAVFKESKRINKISDGAFDPSIGPLIEAWGFDFRDPQKMDSSKVDSLMKFCGLDQFRLKGNWLIKRDSRAKLNFNAIAQGYSVDLMAKVLDKSGVNRYYVELGGEVIVKGKNSRNEWWRIGVDKPEGENLDRKLSAIVSLQNQAMVTSGNYRKYIEQEGEKFYHSLNPKTCFPVKHKLLSATIIADKAATADALATACMVKGFDGAQKMVYKLSGVEALLIYADSLDQLQSFSTKGLEENLEEVNE
jgi:thiamine biosynthesis lipoprotein